MACCCCLQYQQQQQQRLTSPQGSQVIRCPSLLLPSLLLYLRLHCHCQCRLHPAAACHFQRHLCQQPRQQLAAQE
jgi:hypothetical protein